MSRYRIPEQASQAVQGLEWLLRLRLWAGATILVISVFAMVVYSVEIPWILVLVVLGILGASNGFLFWKMPVSPVSIHRWLVALVFGDVLLLTVLLYYTGGAHNPFTVLYVLHITLAVMLLGARYAWFMVGLCGAGFGLLFFSGHMLIGPGGVAVCDDLDFHLQGMLAATLVTGAGVVYFVAHLNRSRAHLREVAAHARELAERERHFSSLLAMAAGVAHELATPLGTIAVAIRELEISSQSILCNEECCQDVRLIRSEVEKCARILERMSCAVNAQERGDSPPVTLGELQPLLANYLPEEISSNICWDVPTTLSWDCRLPCDDLLVILGNILRNAWEATGGATPVRVAMDVVDDCAIFRVSDRGKGMAPEVLERIGEPFFSTKKEQGTNLGLGFFLAKSLTEKRGGTIRVESVPGKGTTITVKIPLMESSYMPQLNLP